jgi:hypothetical protein
MHSDFMMTSPVSPSGVSGDAAIRATAPVNMPYNPNPEGSSTTQPSTTNEPATTQPGSTPQQDARPPSTPPPISFMVRPLPPVAAQWAHASLSVSEREFCSSVGIDDTSQCSQLTVRDLVNNPTTQDYLRYTFAMKGIAEQSLIKKSDQYHAGTPGRR